jgi:hypothetical protein
MLYFVGYFKLLSVSRILYRQMVPHTEIFFRNVSCMWYDVCLFAEQMESTISSHLDQYETTEYRCFNWYLLVTITR